MSSVRPQEERSAVVVASVRAADFDGIEEFSRIGPFSRADEHFQAGTDIAGLPNECD